MQGWANGSVGAGLGRGAALARVQPRVGHLKPRCPNLSARQCRWRRRLAGKSASPRRWAGLWAQGCVTPGWPAAGSLLGAGVSVDCFLASSQGWGDLKCPLLLLPTGAPGVRQGLGRAPSRSVSRRAQLSISLGSPPGVSQQCRGSPAIAQTLAAPCQALLGCAGNAPPCCQVLDLSPQKCKKCNGNQGWPEDF